VLRGHLRGAKPACAGELLECRPAQLPESRDGHPDELDSDRQSEIVEYGADCAGGQSEQVLANGVTADVL